MRGSISAGHAKISNYRLRHSALRVDTIDHATTCSNIDTPKYDGERRIQSVHTTRARYDHRYDKKNMI